MDPPLRSSMSQAMAAISLRMYPRFPVSTLLSRIPSLLALNSSRIRPRGSNSWLSPSSFQQKNGFRGAKRMCCCGCAYVRIVKKSGRRFLSFHYYYSSSLSSMSGLRDLIGPRHRPAPAGVRTRDSRRAAGGDRAGSVAQRQPHRGNGALHAIMALTRVDAKAHHTQ